MILGNARLRQSSSRPVRTSSKWYVWKLFHTKGFVSRIAHQPFIVERSRLNLHVVYSTGPEMSRAYLREQHLSAEGVRPYCRGISRKTELRGAEGALPYSWDGQLQKTFHWWWYRSAAHYSSETGTKVPWSIYRSSVWTGSSGEWFYQNSVQQSKP